MSIETVSYWGDLIKGVSARFAEVFDQEKEGYDPFRYKANLFKHKTSDKTRERHTGKTGVDFFTKMGDGGGLTYDNRLQTYATEYVFHRFGEGVQVTKSQLQDRDFDMILDEFKDLVRAGIESMDKHAFDVFNTAFQTTDASANRPISRYGDGKPLCSTVHPRKDGGTAQSNASSTSKVLSETNLEDGRIAIEEQLTDKGKPMTRRGKYLLLVPPALEKTAVLITHSDQRQGTANNDANFYGGGMMDVLATPWLGAQHGGSDTAWFLVTPETAKLFFWERQGMEKDRQVDFNTKNVKFSVDARWAAGFSDWRGIYGSKGDSSAYSS